MRPWNTARDVRAFVCSWIRHARRSLPDALAQFLLDHPDALELSLRREAVEEALRLEVVLHLRPVAELVHEHAGRADALVGVEHLRVFEQVAEGAEVRLDRDRARDLVLAVAPRGAHDVLDRLQ